MNWRLMIAVFIILITIAGALADDEQLQVVSGDAELQLTSTVWGDIASQGNGPPGQEQGVPVVNVTRYYDVKIVLRDQSLQPAQNVEGVVIIDFMGQQLPTQDGTLTYTLVDPEGNTYPVTQEVLKEGNYQKSIAYLVPLDAASGEWTLLATWSVPGLEPMTAKSVFTVRQEGELLPYYIIGLGVLIVVIIVLFIVFTTKAKASQRKKPRRDQWEAP